MHVRRTRSWSRYWHELRRYPSAVVGLLIILALIGQSLYTVATIPYSEALERWRGGDYWRLNPVNASPVWVNYLTGQKQARTMVITSDLAVRSEEHTSELQSRGHRVCRLLLEKKTRPSTLGCI